MREKCMKRTWLLCLYLSCFKSPLTLATVAAPPALDFSRGQPEVGQPSDNIPIGPMVIKSLQFPTGDGRGYPMLLTNKTTTLLSEALHMLNRVKNVKERRWIKTFIVKLSNLAEMLDESTKNATLQNEVNATVHSEFKPRPTIPTVEGPKSAKTLSKHPKVSMNKVLPNNVIIESHTVTSLQQSELEDELVMQLQNMSKTNQNRGKVHYESTTERSLISMPSTTVVEKNDSSKMEKEKAFILSRLTQDVSRLRRLGGTREDILKILRLDNHNFADFTDPEFFVNEHSNNGHDVANEFEIAEDNQNDDEGINQDRKETKKNELTISSTNDAVRNQAMATMQRPFLPNQQNPHFIPQSLNQRPYMHSPRSYGVPQLFPYKPHHFLNMPQRNGMHQVDGRFGNPERPQNYLRNLSQRQVYMNRNAAQHFEPQFGNSESFPSPGGQHFVPQYVNPESFPVYPGFPNQNSGQRFDQQFQSPDGNPLHSALRSQIPGQHFDQHFQNMEALPPHPAYPDGQFKNPHSYNSPLPKLNPFVNNMNELQTNHHYNLSLQQMSRGMTSSPRVHYQPPYADPRYPRYSDEMERQLRDGKIIVLSDSLVHTNFGPNDKNRGLKGNSSMNAVNAVDSNHTAQEEN